MKVKKAVSGGGPVLDHPVVVALLNHTFRPAKKGTRACVSLFLAHYTQVVHGIVLISCACAALSLLAWVFDLCASWQI